MLNFCNRDNKNKDIEFDLDNFVSSIKNCGEDGLVIDNCNTATTIIINYINNKFAIETISCKKRNYNKLDFLSVYLTLSKKLEEKYEFIAKENKFKINDIPIQLNAWRINRIFNNFFNINDNNILSVDKGKENINNSYLYPMNFIMCDGANHSQFAAISKGNGESFFKGMYDFSKLYDLCRFDGCNFIDNDNKIIELSDDHVSEEILFAGIIFEVGRIRLDEGFENPYA